jgi:polysaccharide biosynthesis protein PelD
MTTARMTTERPPLDDFRTKWARLMAWQGAVWLPVVPPFGALVELAAIIAAIMLADWALPGVDIATLEPSPYWLPVLLLSLQYGTVAGLLAAGISTIAHVLAGLPEQAVGENLFTYLLRIWALPILWIGVSLLLGQFRLRQIEVKQALQQTLGQRTAEAQTLTLYAKDLEQRCHRLERHMTSRQVVSGSGLLDALSALVRTDPSNGSSVGATLASALDTVRAEAFPGAQISLFSVTPVGCELAAKSGWPESAAWPHEIPATHPLYRAITGERRTVSVLNRGDETVLAGHGLAAHPIFSAESGRVAGLIKIEAADASLITEQLPYRLAVIARLVAPALTDPRSAADNRGLRAVSQNGLHNGPHNGPEPVRLTRGWQHHTWRDTARDAASPAAGSALPDPSTAGDAAARSSRPKRAT